jgi:hypothetical protein
MGRNSRCAHDVAKGRMRTNSPNAKLIQPIDQRRKVGCSPKVDRRSRRWVEQLLVVLAAGVTYSTPRMQKRAFYA